MIKISIMYPNHASARFDMPYYVETHMPMSIKLLSSHSGFAGVSVEKGIGGAGPGIEPAYIAMCHYLFDSAESFLAAFSAHAGVLQGDIVNYTNIAPVIQVSEVLLTR